MIRKRLLEQTLLWWFLTYQEQPGIRGIPVVSITVHWWTLGWAAQKSPALSLLFGVGQAPDEAEEAKGQDVNKLSNPYYFEFA